MSVAIGMPQPVEPGPGVDDQGVDQPGAGHAAGRPDQRHDGGADVGQLTVPAFSSDLEAHDQKEDGHQPAVHPFAARW